MLIGWSMYQLFATDIDQFRKASEVTCTREEWTTAMRSIPESVVKDAFALLLGEPTRKDWGGEQADHFSASISIHNRRSTGAFLLKGPASFREMTMDHLGRRADQIYRLSCTPANILFVQHCHLIGEAVRSTLRTAAVVPHRPRHYCLIDGQDTYKILKAYELLPKVTSPRGVRAPRATEKASKTEKVTSPRGVRAPTEKASKLVKKAAKKKG
jgi:hypothetical protein